MERSKQLKTQLMQLLKESLKKIQACRDSNPALFDTGCIALYNWTCSNLPGKHEDDKVHPLHQFKKYKIIISIFIISYNPKKNIRQFFDKMRLFPGSSGPRERVCFAIT